MAVGPSLFYDAAAVTVASVEGLFAKSGPQVGPPMAVLLMPQQVLGRWPSL
ncbi:hypothetical protein KPB2_5556 [Klebsiella pneumoniae Kb677]|nr:hypothetical protein KPB2_5556 [Klebsiella pneumoniae Kb677]